MANSTSLLRVELENIRSRVFAFWGIFLVMGMLLLVLLSISLPNTKETVINILEHQSKHDAIVYVLDATGYPLFFTFLNTLLGPTMILLFVDMIPKELETGQLKLLKTSNTKLTLIFFIRLALILGGSLIPVILVWGVVYIYTVTSLLSDVSLILETLFTAIVPYLVIIICFLVFFSGCLVITFLLSLLTEDQVYSSVGGISLVFVPEILQSNLRGNDVNISVAPSEIFNQLLWSLPLPPFTAQSFEAFLFSEENSFAFIGLVGLILIIASLFLFFMFSLKRREIY